MQEKNQYETTNNYYQDSEMDLAEMLMILVKRKWIVIGALFLSLLIAGMYLWSTKPTFQSQAIIQIGKIGYGNTKSLTSIPIEDRLSLIQRITNTSGFSFPYSVQADKQTDQVYGQINSTIILNAQGKTPIEAEHNLTIVTDSLMKKHQQIFDNMKTLQQKQLDSLQKELKAINSQINLYDSKMLNNGKSDELRNLLVLQRSSLDEKKSKLEQQINEQEMIMSELYTKPTQLLLKPTINNSPIAPQKKMIIILAVFAGLFLGLVIVFMLEFYDKNRNKLMSIGEVVNK